MEAGWYLKTADATEAHWWDGTEYTTHTSPLTGYPFAVHPDPLAAPPAPFAPPAPEPVAPPETVVAATPPVEVPEELPVVDDSVLEDTIIHEPAPDAATVIGPPPVVGTPPVVDTPPVLDAPPIVEPPFTPPALTPPQFGPPEPTVPGPQSFGPPQPTTPVSSGKNFGEPQPTVSAVAQGERHPGYGATASAPGSASEPRKGMNKGLFWGIIGGGALVLVIIIVLIANLLSSVFAVNPITKPVVPPAPTMTSEATDPDDAELPDDSGNTTTRDIDTSTRQVFAGLVTSNIPTLASETEESIVDGGLAVCEMLDEGEDVAAIGGVVTQSGLPDAEAGLFIAYSVTVLCPEYTDVIG